MRACVRACVCACVCTGLCASIRDTFCLQYAVGQSTVSHHTVPVASPSALITLLVDRTVHGFPTMQHKRIRDIQANLLLL